MFHSIPEPIQARMHVLEATDSRDRGDGTPRMERLRQVPPETGRFLALLAASAPPGRVVEIGTSAGYSALWLSLACRATRRRLTTYELLPDKIALARETFAAAEVSDVVTLVAGDALLHEGVGGGLDPIGFCFLDAEKEVYAEAYDLIVPQLAPGGLLVADNALSHADDLGPMIDRALRDPRVDTLVVPIGRGELVCRRTDARPEDGPGA